MVKWVNFYKEYIVSILLIIVVNNYLFLVGLFLKGLNKLIEWIRY